VFIYDQPPTWRSFLRVSPFDLLKIDPWLSMDQVVRRHLHSPHLRQMFGRFATYVGASPYQAPATLSVIAHVELTGGVFYPRGGVYAIAQALARLAGELGVAIHTNAPVAQICILNGRATGIRLANGTETPASAVIANVDVATVYQRLLPDSEAYAAQRQRLARMATSCSGYVLLLGVTRTHPELAHHNIFFTEDYRREFDELFRRGIPPSNPTVYLAITSKTDAGHAPPGCENWFVMVNAPPTNGRFDWMSQELAYRSRIFATLAHYGLDVDTHVCYVKALTPVHLAQHTGAWRGALYGISSNDPLNAFRRPHNRAANVHGLYFVGGTTHPGGGVPLAALSGKVTADLLISDPAH
jgi:phytoene desaturase